MWEFYGVRIDTSKRNTATVVEKECDLRVYNLKRYTRKN